MDAPNLDLELERLIEQGDRRRAATMLVERFASDVYALCRAMVRDGTLAEDLSQDAFGRAISALESFRGESSPRTWLLKIARNRCLDHLAQIRRAPFETQGEHDVDAHPEDAPGAIDLLVRREDAQRALGALAETERAIIVLHFGHGVGYSELAEAFGLKEGAVRMRVSRAVARMREELQVELGAPRAAAMAAPLPDAMPAGPPMAGGARKSAGGIFGSLGRWVRGERGEQAPPTPAAPIPAAQPPVAQPSVAQPSVAQPSVAQPPVAQPSVAQPSVVQSPVAQSPIAPSLRLGAPAAARAPGAPPPPSAPRAAAPPPAAPPAPVVPPRRAAMAAPAAAHPLHDDAPAPLLGRLRALLDAI